MIIAALFIITRYWKKTLTEERIRNICNIFTMENYSAVKNANPEFSGKWMEQKKSC